MPKKLLALGSLAAVLLTASAAPAVTPGEDTGVMVDALVLDRAGNPVPGLNRGDFEITIGDQVRPVSGARMLSADTTPRRFVFIVNRRGALPAQLRRMKEGLEEFVSARFGERDDALFVDFAEVPRITRGWRTGPTEALPEIRNITPMGFRSSLGPAEDTADAAFMLQALAGRLADLPGRKVVVLFSASLSTFAGTPGGDLEPVALGAGLIHLHQKRERTTRWLLSLTASTPRTAPSTRCTSKERDARTRASWRQAGPSSLEPPTT